MRVQNYFSAAEGPSRDFSAIARKGDRASISVWCSPLACTGAPKSSQDMRPTIDYAESLESGKKAKNRSEGRVCLLTKGVLIRVRCAGLGKKRHNAAAMPPIWASACPHARALS